MAYQISSWQELVQLPVVRFQCGRSQDTIDAWTGEIFEEPLLIQSNARILIGQGVNSVFRFAALPTQVYPVPIFNKDFEFYAGMYHHTDNVVYVGDVSYSLITNGKEINLTDSTGNAETRYAMHFLPITKISENELEISIISCAPVSDSGASIFRGAPLPGPSGAIYAIVIKNTSGNIASGILRLKASDKLIGDYEDLKPKIWKTNAAKSQIRRGTFMLIRPEGCAGIHLQGGEHSFDGNTFISELSYNIPPGESNTFCTYIVLGSDYNSITPELYYLTRRDPLDWFAMTVDFWRDRLPKVELSGSGEDDIIQRTQEFYIRCLLDNFNCIQTDVRGNLLAHRQGAPSHGYGTIWGIDLEPTIISVSIICPELAEQALIFFLDKTRPGSSFCKPNHSISILCAPVLIAAFMLRQTGDLGIFSRSPKMAESLISIMDEILEFKHNEECLFSTYWSSDGHVGRRYDYGVNIKLYYAFNGLAYILEVLGKDGKKYSDIAKGIVKSIARTMVVKGPFGLMLSGGTNLDTGDDGIFIKDNAFPYFDGEDTSTMLAPVYGACADDWEPWVNYQRFGRSLFCQNYQAETDVRSWFPHDGIALDGTAVLASVGGSVSRQEMIDTTRTAIGFIDPVTGSSFWWPSGPVECRKLTRCSQGHGAWVWYYRSRWLGLETNGVSRVLTFNPKGLPLKLRILPNTLFPFEVAYDEATGICEVTNFDKEPWTVKTGFRKPGCGAEGYRQIQNAILKSGEKKLFIREKEAALDSVKIDNFSKRDILAAEGEFFALDGIIFFRQGALRFWFQNNRPPLDLRFVVGNITGIDWQSVQVRLTMPQGCTSSPRFQGALRSRDVRPDGLNKNLCIIGSLKSGERKTACFAFYMPAMRPVAGHHDPAHRSTLHLDNDALFEADVNTSEVVNLRADLEAVGVDGKQIRRSLEFKAGYTPAREK
jgi:hypothetical protein